MKKTNLWISTLATLLIGATAQAEMITVGGDPAAGTATLTINEDITFTITEATGPTYLFFIFDEIVTSDDSLTTGGFSGLEFSVNGGDKASIEDWRDNQVDTFGDVTANDGWIYGPTVYTVVADDTVTLHAGTGSMLQPVPSFNPWSSGDYDLFIVDIHTGNKISGIGAVPEPATAGLLGISALVLYGLRRVKNFNRA